MNGRGGNKGWPHVLLVVNFKSIPDLAMVQLTGNEHQVGKQDTMGLHKKTLI